MNETKVPENRAFKVTLILLVGLAAFSTAMKDLNRLQEMVSSVQEFTSQSRASGRGADMAMLNVDSIANESCPNDSPDVINAVPKSNSSYDDSQAREIEIERTVHETNTEPEVGGKVELVSSKRVHSNLAHLARAKYDRARDLKPEIAARRRVGNWPQHFEFKTSDRTVTIDLPITMLTHIKADAFETEGSPDLPVRLLFNRKQLPGKTDNGRREIIIKRFERSYGSRRAS